MRRLMVFVLLAMAASAQETPLESAERKLASDDWRGAVADYTKAIEAAPEDARAYTGRGFAYQMLGGHELALKDLTKAIEIAADSALHASRAYSHLELGAPDAAIADCDRAIALALEEMLADSPRAASTAHRLRGDALCAKHDTASALTDYDHAARLNPRSALAFERRGLAKQALLDYPGSVEDFDRVVEREPGREQGYAQRGRARTYVGDLAGAIEDFRTALAKGGAGADQVTRVSLARALWALGEHAPADAEVAKAAAAVAPPAADREAAFRRVAVIEAVGRYYFDTGRPKEAAAMIGSTVAVGTDYSKLYFFLARARLGERAHAARQLKAHADGLGKKDDWYAHLAYFMCGQRKEEQLFAAAKSPNSQLAREQECEACWYAGAIRLLDGDTAGAKALFERCVQTDLRSFIEYESAKMALAAMK